MVSRLFRQPPGGGQQRAQFAPQESVDFEIGVPSTTATASDGTSSVSPQPAATTVSTARAVAASMSERFIRFLF